MDGSAKSIQVKVGLFTAISVLALMLSILLLGGDKKFFTRYVYLHARFTEVQGLFPGSVVSLAGVPVGNIEDISFAADDNKLDVKMRIDLTYADRLFEGTSAEVRTQGALGDKYIYLTPGSRDAKLLTNHAKVPSIETDFLKMLTDPEDGAARVIDAIKEIHVLVANFNAGGRSGLMARNLTESSEKLNSVLSKLDSLLGDVESQIPTNKKLRNALVSLSNIMEKIDQGKGTLGQLINDPTIHQNLKTVLGSSPRHRYMKEMIRDTIQKSEESPAGENGPQ